MNVYAHPLTAVFWLLAILGQFLLAFIALVQRSTRPQRFFGVLILVMALRETLLYASSLVGAAGWYSSLYWPTLALCTVGIVIQAAISYKDLFYPPSSMPRRFHRQFLSLTLLLTIIVAGSHLFSLSQPMRSLVGERMLWYRSLSLWLCGFYWVLGCLAQYWSLRLHSRAYGVAVGMMFNLTTNLALGFAFADATQTGIPRLYFVQMLCEVATISIWLRYFLRLESPVFVHAQSPWARLRESLILSIWGEMGARGRRPATTQHEHAQEKYEMRD